MVTEKESIEYIELIAPQLIKSDLAKVSENFRKSMETAFEDFHLIKQNHEDIKKARKLANSIIKDIKEFDNLMKREVFRDVIGKEKVEEYIPVPIAKLEKPKPHRITVAEKEFEKKSAQALKNLQRNLEALKRQLGVE